MLVHCSGESDRAPRDLLPVSGIEVIVHIRADRSGEQPQGQGNADGQFHRDLSAGRINHPPSRSEGKEAGWRCSPFKLHNKIGVASPCPVTACESVATLVN